MKKIKLFIYELTSAIYPHKCIGCGDVLNVNSYLCDRCNTKFERIDLNNICLNCGQEKNECVCRYSIYRFNSLTSAFKNSGIARKAYYSYKFYKNQHYSKFFAKELSLAVLNCYENIRFDFICSVPSFNKFAYDHSGYLAKETSKLLDIPFEKNIISCVKKGKKQHKSTIEQRLKNVCNKYRVNKKIDNKKILLIDDIKTTGATLDECARELLFAGADSVYCATLLVATNSN